MMNHRVTSSVNENRAFTLTEVVVSAVVFATAVAGMMATIRVLSMPATESSQDLQAVFAARSVIDELRSNLTADLWENALGPIGPGNHTMTETVGGRNYFITYEVMDDASMNGVREVIMNVAWD